MKKITVFLIIILICGCSGNNESSSPSILTPPYDQGLTGRVEYWEGNFMPVVPEQSPDGIITYVEREICVFEKTSLDDVELAGEGNLCFYNKINTKLITKARSDENGNFKIGLPPGMYSVFVKENGTYYANGFSDDYIWPVTIEENMFSEYDIKITYAACF